MILYKKYTIYVIYSICNILTQLKEDYKKAEIDINKMDKEIRLAEEEDDDEKDYNKKVT